AFSRPPGAVGGIGRWAGHGSGRSSEVFSIGMSSGRRPLRPPLEDARNRTEAKSAAVTRRSQNMPTITPFLWFDTQAEEAMQFYASVFKRSKVTAVNRAQGKAMSVQFELEGQPFMALNAGPLFKFTEAISFFVGCETQAEIDELWGKLTADGGAPSRCGWLKDKFGLSWQIVPTSLG